MTFSGIQQSHIMKELSCLGELIDGSTERIDQFVVKMEALNFWPYTIHHNKSSLHCHTNLL